MGVFPAHHCQFSFKIDNSCADFKLGSLDAVAVAEPLSKDQALISKAFIILFLKVLGALIKS